jgi:hypothetical protein
VSVVRFRPWAPSKHLGRLANCFCLYADAFVRFVRCNRFASKSPKKFFLAADGVDPRGYIDRPPGVPAPPLGIRVKCSPKKERYLESKMSVLGLIFPELQFKKR